MEFNDIYLKFERLRELKKKLKERKEALEELKKHPIGMQTLKIGYESAVGYMNSSIDFTENEVIDMLELIVSKMIEEIEKIKNELNGKIIEID